MNSKKSFISKITALPFIFLLFLSSSHAQVKPDTHLKKVNFRYGSMIELKINQPIQMKDGLKIVLTGFSHKIQDSSSMPAPAFAHLLLSKGNVSQKIELSTDGGQYRYTESSPGEYRLLDFTEPFPGEWRNYEFQLGSANWQESFKYGDSIKIIVKKVDFKYGAVIELKANQPIYMKDGLTIVLTDFSDKIQRSASSVRASAYLLLSKGDAPHDLIELNTERLYTHKESLPEIWGNYEFRLKSFKYGESIKIVIDKKR